MHKFDLKIQNLDLNIRKLGPIKKFKFSFHSGFPQSFISTEWLLLGSGALLHFGLCIIKTAENLYMVLPKSLY